MAKLLGPGGISPQGRAGGFTFYQLNGQTIMRRLPSSHRNKTHPTPLQLLNRQRFREINAFLKPIKMVLNFGFQNQSSQSRIGIHCAFKYLANKGYNFGQTPRIDPAHLKISEGPLLEPEQAQATRTGNQIQLTWADSLGKGSTFIPDYSLILLYNPDSACYRWFKDLSTRSSLHTEISLSAQDIEKSWCVYLAFYRNKEPNSYIFSDSCYLGKV